METPLVDTFQAVPQGVNKDIRFFQWRSRSTLLGYLELLETNSDTFMMGRVIIKFLASFPKKKLDTDSQNLFDRLYPNFKEAFQSSCMPRYCWIDFNDDLVFKSLRNDISRVAARQNLTVPFKYGCHLCCLFGESDLLNLNGHDLDPQSADIFPDMDYIIKDEDIAPPLCKHVRDVYYRMARQEVKSKQISSPFLVALLSHIQPDEPPQPSECSNFKLLMVVFQKVCKVETKTTSFITERLTKIPDTLRYIDQGQTLPLHLRGEIKANHRSFGHRDLATSSYGCLAAHGFVEIMTRLWPMDTSRDT